MNVKKRGFLRRQESSFFEGPKALFCRSVMTVLIIPCQLPHGHGAGKKTNQVGKNHQSVEHVGHIPDKLHLQGRPSNDENHDQDGVEFHGLAPEQMAHIDLPEIVPTYNGGEGKEKHTDGHKYFSEGTKGGIKGALGKGRTGQPVVPHTGGENDKSGECQDDKGINKYADHGDNALVAGMRHIRCRVGMGRGTHAGLVGEKPPCHTVAHGLLDSDAQSAAGYRLWGECAHKDVPEGFRHTGKVCHQNKETSQDVKQCHNRHDFFCKAGDSADTAQEDKACHQGNTDSHQQRRHMKGVLKGISDGIGLYHVPHESQGKYERHREEAGKETAEASFESVFYVIDGPPDKGAVFDNPGVLCHDSLGINGRHAEKCAHPHPEDGSRASGGDGRRCPGDISCSHLRRDGCGECLEGAEAVLACLSVEREVAEQSFHACSEFSYLDEPEHE